MTTLNTAITFNASTGDDAAASGCPSNATAIAVMIQTSAGSNTATASWTGTLSAGDLMYIPDSSFTGRKFNVIASVGSGSLTFDDNWDDSSFGTSGYVGGKRATFDDADSRKIFQEIGPQFKGSIQTETDQTITSSIVPVGQATGCGGIVKSANEMKTITQTANAPHFKGGGGAGYVFKNLKFANSYSGVNQPIFQWNNQQGQCHVRAFGCVFGDATNPCKELHYGGGSYRSAMQIDHCVVQYMTDSIAFRNNTQNATITNSLFQNNSYAGVGFTSSSGGTKGEIRNCIFANQPRGVSQPRMSDLSVIGNIFFNCSQFGVIWTLDSPVAITNNLFVDCATAISNANNQANVQTQQNFFYNNTAKYVNQNFAASAIPDVDLTSDPFVNSASADWSISNSAGGAALRATNFALNTDTKVYPFRPFVSDNFGGGGSGSIFHPLAQ